MSRKSSFPRSSSKRRSTPKLSQQDFFAQMLRGARSGFGGTHTARSHPTQARPFARRTPVHVVLRSDWRGGRLWRFDREIQKILSEESRRVRAELMALANAGNHMHLIVSFLSPQAQRRFLRAVAGRIARLVSGARKASPQLKEGESFWAGRPFTRIAGWGRALTNLKRYLTLNSQEQLYQGTPGQRRAQARRALARLEDLGLVSFGYG